MIKMVVSDVDGTLLPHSRQSLPEQLFEQIRQLKELGILFVAASGRQIGNLCRLFAPVEQEIGYIAENGGLTVYQGKVLDKGSFSMDLTKEIAQAVWEDDSGEFSISGERTYYIHPKTQEFLWLMRDYMHNDIRIIQDFSEIPEECLKVSLFDQKHLEAKIPYWTRRFGDRARVVTSGNDWLDFMPGNVHKGNGVRCFQKTLGITPEECMAFGDEHNDIEMLQSVRYSYAVTTAREKVKAVSRFETENVMEILARLIDSGGKLGG